MTPYQKNKPRLNILGLFFSFPFFQIGVTTASASMEDYCVRLDLMAATSRENSFSIDMRCSI